MDTVATALTTALSAGAAAGLTDLAKKAIADGYNALKSLLHKKLGENSEVSHAIAGVEAKPDSAGRRATLAEEIEASHIAGDSEILASAQALLKLLESFPGHEHKCADCPRDGNRPGPGRRQRVCEYLGRHIWRPGLKAWTTTTTMDTKDSTKQEAAGSYIAQATGDGARAEVLVGWLCQCQMHPSRSTARAGTRICSHFFVGGIGKPRRVSGAHAPD